MFFKMKLDYEKPPAYASMCIKFKTSKVGSVVTGQDRAVPWGQRGMAGGNGHRGPSF